MFYSEFIDGSYKQAPYNRSHIVLTERAAMKYFGKTDCTGEIFPAENKKVAGVIRDYPANSDLHFEFLLLSKSGYDGQGLTSFYVQINPNAQISNVLKKIESHRSVAKATNCG